MGSRNERYLQKSELAKERIANIREWHLGGNDLKSRLATYKAFQEASEAVMDICAMLCKDSGKAVKDDYENIEKLRVMKIITEETSSSLREMNGMRNRIIHEYNGFSYKMFSGNAERLIKDAENFLGVVDAWQKKSSRK